MTQTQKQNVPKLRFPGFEAALESVKLGDVATFSKGKGISKSDIDPDGDQFCIRYGELYTVYDTIIDQPISKTSIPASNLKLSKGDEVLVPASGEDAKDIATAAVVKQAGVALGGDLNIIHSKNDGAFLASYLSGRKRMTLAAMAQGNSVVHLYPAQLKTLDLHLPTLPEQRKIASFLGAVDAKIAHLSRKKALLEDYKKGCMQQLFSQKIRFKDDDGNDFPDWEEKRLGELCDVSSSKRVLQKDWLEEGVPFLRTREIINLSKGVSFRTPIFISEKLFEELKAKYGTPKEGDILVTGVGSIGETYVVKGTDKFYFKDGNVLWIKKSRKLDPNFLNYLFQTPSVKKQLSDNASITTVATFTIDGAKKTILCYPHPAEQRKIADFLSALDRKIDLVAQELTHARSFKAGLLQQMFI